MYVEYVRNMYLDNKLCQRGALTMAGEKVDLERLEMPAYVYASREDHIVPWKSAYASTHLLGGDITFVLGASGTIAGVVNPPAKKRRNYWTNPELPAKPGRLAGACADACRELVAPLGAWLARRAGTRRAAPREIGSAAHRRSSPRRDGTCANRPGRTTAIRPHARTRLLLPCRFRRATTPRPPD
jgi:polyhydroxyalkanoate synthase